MRSAMTERFSTRTDLLLSAFVGMLACIPAVVVLIPILPGRCDMNLSFLAAIPLAFCTAAAGSGAFVKNLTGPAQPRLKSLLATPALYAWIVYTVVMMREPGQLDGEGFADVGIAGLLVLGGYGFARLGFAKTKYAQQREQSRSECPSCGYDLTGNTSGTCPECGAAIGSRG